MAGPKILVNRQDIFLQVVGPEENNAHIAWWVL
jgi:hypothetical protein